MTWKEPSSERSVAGHDNYSSYAEIPHASAECLPVAAALDLLAPWSNSPRKDLPRYPGRNAILIEALGAKVDLRTIQGWRYGRRKPPQWARDLLASRLERISESAAAVAKLLRSENEKAPD